MFVKRNREASCRIKNSIDYLPTPFRAYDSVPIKLHAVAKHSCVHSTNSTARNQSACIHKSSSLPAILDIPYVYLSVTALSSWANLQKEEREKRYEHISANKIAGTLC
jgi:hypothetical protein